jgi:hypothetical protein
VILLSGVLLHPHGALRADGGAVRVSERKGDYQITVFTSPTPLQAGPVDVSVLVQDTVGGGPVPQARVLVRATPRRQPGVGISYPATTEAATNKLFRSAVFDLPEPGVWDVEIVIEGLRVPLRVHYQMEAEEPLTRLDDLGLWIAWPAVAILVFAVHQWLVRRRVVEYLPSQNR